MKVLLGTTNPSKVKRFEDLLSDYDVEFYTLKDLGVADEPLESGRTPEENAIIKAKFYSSYFDVVICNDSGLYFEELPLDDIRQPGLNIRTPNGRSRLSDEEAIEYYTKLISSLGGKVNAFYMDALAVYNKGEITVFPGKETVKTQSFYMTNKVSDKRPQRHHNPTIRKSAKFSAEIISHRHKSYVCPTQEQHKANKRINKTDTDTVYVFLLQF